MRPEYRLEPARTALNRVSGMSFRWSLNPYTGCVHRCTFCFVRAFERRADRPSDERYGTVIRVKTNVAELLDRELARRSWKRELVAVGTATDPYQPAEGRFRLTRACLEALAVHRTPVHLITRGPLIVRDIDVLVTASRSARLSVTISIPTLDREIWRRTEPGTAPPARRLHALSRLVAAGIDVGVGMAPILPGLSDDPRLLEDVVRAARDAGATGAWANLLYLRPGTREHFLGHLARDWPELLPRYESLYQDRAYLPSREQAPVRAAVRELVRRHGVVDRRAVRLAPDPEPEQLALPLAPGEAPLGPAGPSTAVSPPGIASARRARPAQVAGRPKPAAAERRSPRSPGRRRIG